MKALLTRTITLIQDTLTGRRRLARYQHPEAHRPASHDPDSTIANHYVPTNGIPPMGGM